MNFWGIKNKVVSNDNEVASDDYIAKNISNTVGIDGERVKLWEVTSRDNNVKTYFVTMASTVPSTLTEAPTYLKTINTFKKSVDRSSLIDLCRKIYRSEGVVRTAIDTIVRFTNTRPYIHNVKNDDLRKLLTYWLHRINGNWVIDDVIKNGGSFIGSGVSHLVAEQVRTMLVDMDWVGTVTWQKDVDIPLLGKKFVLPVSTTKWDALSTTIQKIGGKTFVSVNIDRQIRKIVTKKGKLTDFEKELLKSLSPDIIKLIKSGKSSISLPTSITYVLNMGSEPTDPSRGLSYIQPALDALAHKWRLLMLDNATIAGLIQSLTIIMVGKTDFTGPGAERMNAEARKLSQKKAAQFATALARREANMMLVWPGNDVVVEQIGPKGSVLEFEGRFAEADDNISLALGMPRLLLDGMSAGTQSRDEAVFKSALAKMVEIQNILEREFYTPLAWQIAQLNGFKDEDPIIEFQTPMLMDTQTYRQTILRSYELGTISLRDYWESLGKDYEEQVWRKQNEIDNGVVELFPPLITNTPSVDAGVGRPPDIQKTKTAPERENESVPSSAVLKNRDKLVSSIIESYKSALEKMPSAKPILHDNVYRQLVSLGFSASEIEKMLFKSK